MGVWVEFPETFVTWLGGKSDSGGGASRASSEPDVGAISLCSSVDVEGVGEGRVSLETPDIGGRVCGDVYRAVSARGSWADVLVRRLSCARSGSWGFPLDHGFVDTSSSEVRVVTGNETKTHTTGQLSSSNKISVWLIG